MNTSVLTLTPGGRPLAQSLGFEAATVTVDNYTSSYVVLADAGKTVPPWVYGAVVALPPGIRTASASLVATVPAVAGPPVPTSQAVLTWTDAVLSPDPGHLLQQSQYGQSSVLAHITANANGSFDQFLNVPAGTQSIGWIVDALAGDGQGPASVNIEGVQTSKIYVSEAFPFSGQTIFATPITPVDTTVEVFGNARAAAACGIYVIAWAVGPVVPLTAVIAATNGGVLQGVSMQLASPAPWQAATANAPATVASVASGGTQTLIAASAGVTLYLHGYSFSQDNANAASAWQLQDSTGTVIASWFDTNVRKVFAAGDFRGFPVTTGRGVRISNGGALASFVGGFLSYSTG